MNDKQISRWLALLILACIAAIACLGTFALGVRLLDWAFST